VLAYELSNGIAKFNIFKSFVETANTGKMTPLIESPKSNALQTQQM